MKTILKKVFVQKIPQNIRNHYIMRLKRKLIKILNKKIAIYRGLNVKHPSLCTVGLERFKACYYFFSFLHFLFQ